MVTKLKTEVWNHDLSEKQPGDDYHNVGSGSVKRRKKI